METPPLSRQVSDNVGYSVFINVIIVINFILDTKLNICNSEQVTLAIIHCSINEYQ